MATSPFLWGSGGAKLTPEEIALQRSVLARRRAQGIDISPVASPLQGLARVADAWADKGLESDLNASAAENAKVNQDILTSLLGGGSPAASTGVAASLSPSSASPSNNGASTASQAAGVPPSVANSQPYELAASLVGKGEIPDRAVISEYLKNGGVNLDPATTAWCAAYVNSTLNQSGYKGTNSLAARSFLNYGTPVETPQKGDIAVFSRGNDPSLGHVGFFDSLNADGTIKILAGNQGDAVGYGIMSPDRLLGYRRPVPINGDGVVADMPTQRPTPIARPQVAQAQTVAPTNSLGVSPAVLQALTSPYANDQTKGVAKLLLQQQQQKQEAAQAQDVWMQRQRYEQEMQNADPLRQLQIQKAQIDVNSANQSQRQPLLNLGNGTVYDPNAPEDKRFIQSPNAGQNTPDSVRALEIRAERAGLKPGTQEYNQFMLSGGGGGTSLSVGPNGEVSFQQGGAYKPTEGQSKDAFFSTRLQSATPTIDQYESSLLSLPEAAAGAIPFNLGRYAQSKEYQLAKDAGDDFVAAYLRKDSGAALTKEEKSEYGNLLLPQPGDKSEVVEAKRRRRQVAIAAINSGLPVAGVDSVLKALGSVQGATEPAGKSQASSPKRLKFTATGELVE